MYSYYIEERNMDMTYLELRLLLYVDCQLKYEKITKILNFLNRNGFINHLTMLYSENMRADNIPERENVMSLTIDMRDEKMRFKFWNGANTVWVFHTDDLFEALNKGRDDFSKLYDKYKPITDLLLDFEKRWSTSFKRISYRYASSGDNEVMYNIVFTKDVEDTDYASKILSKINKEIIMLVEDVTKDLKFSIEYEFESTGCSACEKARKEREKNETKG